VTDKGGEPALLAPVEETYRRFLELFGPNAEGVGWRAESGQRLRFRVLARLIEQDEKHGPFTLADYGCGYGALLPWLAERYGGRLLAYTGYDICPEMLAAARRRQADPRAAWVHSAQPVQAVDYAMVSGTFNIKADADEATWRGFVEDRLAALARISRRGLAFNMLAHDGERRGSDLFYTDPLPWVAFCRRRLSRRLVLCQDYPLDEWTILLRFD